MNSMVILEKLGLLPYNTIDMYATDYHSDILIKFKPEPKVLSKYNLNPVLLLAEQTLKENNDKEIEHEQVRLIVIMS